MHEEKILVYILIKAIASFWFLFLKVVVLVFETLKYIDFQGGIPTFSKMRQCFKGDFFSMHMAYERSVKLYVKSSCMSKNICKYMSTIIIYFYNCSHGRCQVCNKYSTKGFKMCKKSWNWILTHLFQRPHGIW